METFYRADFSEVQLVARAEYGESKITSLFCRISSLLYVSFPKETNNDFSKVELIAS